MKISNKALFGIQKKFGQFDEIEIAYAVDKQGNKQVMIKCLAKHLKKDNNKEKNEHT